MRSAPTPWEPPDQLADQVDRQPLAVVERDQLVHQPFGMHPAQRMGAYSKLTGIVGDDDDFVEQTVLMDAAEERAFGRYLDRCQCRTNFPQKRRSKFPQVAAWAIRCWLWGLWAWAACRAGAMPAAAG